MAIYSELKSEFVLNLYDWAVSPGASGEISEAKLYDLAIDQMGGATIKAILSELFADGYIQQTTAGIDETDTLFAIRPAFFQYAEDLSGPTQQVNRIGSFKQFRDNLLVALALRENEKGPNYYDLKEVADSAQLKYNKGWVRKAAYYFRDHAYINDGFSIGGGTDGNLSAELTAEGLELAEELNGGLANGVTLGGALTLSSSTLSGGDVLNGIPASDRKVSLNHNQEPYLSLRKTLEEIVIEFKNDHRLDNELGKERLVLESSLNSALQLLDDVVVEVGALIAHIVRPLERFAVKYDQVIVGVLANEAIALVKQLIQIGLQ